MNTLVGIPEFKGKWQSTVIEYMNAIVCRECKEIAWRLDVIADDQNTIIPVPDTVDIYYCKLCPAIYRSNINALETIEFVCKHKRALNLQEELVFKSPVSAYEEAVRSDSKTEYHSVSDPSFYVTNGCMVVPCFSESYQTNNHYCGVTRPESMHEKISKHRYNVTTTWIQLDNNYYMRQIIAVPQESELDYSFPTLKTNKIYDINPRQITFDKIWSARPLMPKTITMRYDIIAPVFDVGIAARLRQAFDYFISKIIRFW